MNAGRHFIFKLSVSNKTTIKETNKVSYNLFIFISSNNLRRDDNNFNIQLDRTVVRLNYIHVFHNYTSSYLK